MKLNLKHSYNVMFFSRFLNLHEQVCHNLLVSLTLFFKQKLGNLQIKNPTGISDTEKAFVVMYFLLESV